MLDFFETYGNVISPVTSLAMVAIWLIYLQVFYNTYRRQKRTSIHIDRGAAKDETARCLVTNLGKEPIYVLAVVVDFGRPDGTSRAVVTDRDELNDMEVASPMDRTAQGPLSQGQVYDIGSLEDLMLRGRARLGVGIDRDELQAMWVSLVAISTQGEHVVAAAKGFDVMHHADHAPTFSPRSVLTDQIRSRWRRRGLLALLEDRDEL